MKKIIFSLLLVTLFSSCKHQTKTNSKATITSKIDSLLQSETDLQGPGGSVLLTKGKEIIYQKNFGLSDIETKEKITEQTSFNTGSISKTFVSNAILILQERGLLSVEDSLSEYFNDFKNKDIANKVKIKHLLSHTSGLPDNRKIEDNIEHYLTAKDTANFAPLKLTDTLEFEPGEKFNYSNPAFNGLALIIEKHTKEKWQKFVVENILEPSNTKIVLYCRI